MKTILRYIIPFVTVLCFGIFTSCDDCDTAEVENTAYLMESTGLNASTSFVIPDAGKTVMVTPRITKIATEDITLELYIDADALTRYNKTYNTNYEVLNETHVVLEQTQVVIPAGKAVATPVAIRLTPLTIDENKSGISYALPISVRAIDSNIPTNKTAGSFIYAAIPVPMSDVPCLTSYCTMKLPLAEDFIAKEWTFEMLFNPGNLNRNSIPTWGASAVGYNPVTGQLDNIQSGFMLRLGDAGANPPGDCFNGRIQGAARGVGKLALTPNVWHHVAIVVKGGMATVYVNGVADYSNGVALPEVRILKEQGIRLAGENRTGTRLYNGKYRYAQVRLWKEARTIDQLNNNRYGVPEDSPNLFGYWKLNSYTEGKAVVNSSDTEIFMGDDIPTMEIDTYFFKDATGHNPDGFVDRNPSRNTTGLEFAKDKRIEVGYNFEGQLP